MKSARRADKNHQPKCEIRNLHLRRRLQRFHESDTPLRIGQFPLGQLALRLRNKRDKTSKTGQQALLEKRTLVVLWESFTYPSPEPAGCSPTEYGEVHRTTYRTHVGEKPSRQESVIFFVQHAMSAMRACSRLLMLVRPVKPRHMAWAGPVDLLSNQALQQATEIHLSSFCENTLESLSVPSF